MTRLYNVERETIIRRAVSDRQWSVFTEDPVMIRKLDRLGYQAYQETAHGKRYKLPPAALSFRRPRQLTPEQLEAARAKGALLASKRKAAALRQNLLKGGGDYE